MDKFKQLENVNIGEVCRACFETCEQYKMLFEIGENSEKRSWGDVFFDVVKIEAPTSPESSPCRICLPCCNDLLSAFTFIQKSKENNDRLLEFLKTANIKQSDCLSEFPIDIPKESNTSDYLHIKVEDESINEYCYTDDKHSAQSSSESEGSDDEPLFHKQGKHKKMQCTYCNRIFKRWDFFENHMKRHEEDTKQKDGSAGEALKTIMCDECEFTCNTRQELKLHQISTHTSSKKSKTKLKTRGQRSLRSQTKKMKITAGRFECDSCNKTFAWKKDLFRHEKCHEPNTKKYSCPHCDRRFIRKDKLSSHILVHLADKTSATTKRSIKSLQYYSHLLYSENRFKEIKCMLCNYESPSNVSELRRHIIAHDNVGLIEDLEKSEVVKRFYPGRDMQEVIALLGSQIANGQLDKLYSIVNENTFEMGISDSDDSDPQVNNYYTCEVCNEAFNRKHKVMSHQAYEHNFEECPYKCEMCMLKFTSKRLLESHLKYHCGNPAREFHCKKCPARFTWHKNLQNHRCATIILTTSDKDLSIKKKTDIPDGRAHSCTVCGEKFLRPHNLRRHLKTHDQRGIIPLRAKRIVCLLCNVEFSGMRQLKSHLFSHSDGQTGVNFANCEFATNFHPNEEQSAISEHIRNCFKEERLWQLYMAVNKFNQEMILSDSDSEDEAKSLDTPSYTCELCNVKFTRLQDTFQHQLIDHAFDKTLPQKCTKCEDQFVCTALLARHTKYECSTVDRIHTCKACGVAFIWEQHFAAHSCPLAEKPTEDNKQCDVCGKKFIWMKDLHRHRRSHISDEKKFQCLICDRKFNRKDNMTAHMKVHSVDHQEQKARAVVKWEQQDENLCRPHGVKNIQCKICLSKHNSIRDLATHLMTHKDQESLKSREVEIDEISMLLYNRQMDIQELTNEIRNDLANGTNMRFYSITNEVGYELNLIDSETSSDLDAEDFDDDENCKPKGYICELCSKSFNRKFKFFEHQKNEHSWKQLPFECTTCSAKFACQNLFNCHLQSECESSGKQYKCKQCPVRFTWKENLKTHERREHDKNHPVQSKKYPCSSCDKSFLWQRDLMKHKKTHQTEEEKFECTWCFRVFVRKDNLKVHMKVHQNTTHLLLPDIYYLARPNGSKKANCKLCDQKFTRVRDLLEHIQTAHLYGMLESIPSPTSYSITNALGYEMGIEDSETETEKQEEKYACEICNAHFNRRFKLLQHQQALHYSDNIPHKCNFCNFKCVSEVVLSYHMRSQCLNISKQFRCSKCTMRFMWKENLENHEILIHDNPRTHTCEICKRDFATQHDLKGHSDCKPPADVKLFECEMCDRKYNRKDRLMKHVKVHHSDSAPKEPRAKSTQSTDKKFLCAFCGKEVSSSSNLVIHMRRHTGEKPFKCEFCNKGFPRSSDLSCHRRTHTGERPHKCTVCEKAFSRSYKLQTHMRIHSGERPYKCTYCDKSFTQSNDLTLHVRRHTGERPYICETCGERFIQGTALRNHRRMRGHYEM